MREMVIVMMMLIMICGCKEKGPDVEAEYIWPIILVTILLSAKPIYMKGTDNV